MIEQTIKIQLSPEEIHDMSDSDKLNLLLKIAMDNRTAIDAQKKLLEGNGGPGLCEMIRSIKIQITWLWVSFSAVAGFYGGAFLNHVNK